MKINAQRGQRGFERDARKVAQLTQRVSLTIELNSPTTQSCEICPLRRTVQSQVTRSHLVCGLIVE
jgi:hypothetical protein